LPHISSISSNKGDNITGNINWNVILWKTFIIWNQIRKRIVITIMFMVTFIFASWEMVHKIYSAFSILTSSIYYRYKLDRTIGFFYITLPPCIVVIRLISCWKCITCIINIRNIYDIKKVSSMSWIIILFLYKQLSIQNYGGWFVSFVFSPRDPAKRKVGNKQVEMAGARSENILISEGAGGS
jgi:hypothetical protein